MLPQRSLFVLLLGLGSAAAAACYVGPLEKDASPTTEASPTDAENRDADGDGIPDSDGVGSGGGASPTDPAAGNASGLPCDVDAVLAQKCRSCHGAKLKSPMALLTYEDLVAPSKSDPSTSVAALSLARMKDLEKPMPPSKASAATASELAAFDRWLAAGLPAGTCAKADAGASASSGGTTSGGTTSGGTTSSGGAPVDAGTDAGGGGTCSTGLMWTSRDPGSRMNPGRACLGCHTSFAGRPILQIAGTVYETLHEVDKCYGTQVPAYVVVKDATGRSVTLTTGATGNFTLSTNVAPLVYPISVKVVRNGKENPMLGSPPHGDCNACHTESGKNGAPGRIVLP